MRKIIAIIWCGVALIASGTIAQPRLNQNQLQEIGERYYAQYHRQEHFSALSIAVGQQLPLKPVNIAIGHQSKKQRQQITAKSVFQIGSITKSYIAALILKLQTEGKCRLSDPIVYYFPQFTKWGHITIKNLLNMTSGIPDYLQDPEIIKAIAMHPNRQQPLTHWISMTYHQPLLYSAGKGFNYSNTNYLLLGQIIEKITHQSVTTALSKRILQPLGLTHTYYQNDQLQLLKNTVHGYQSEQGFNRFIPVGADVTHFNLSYLEYAGNMQATATDLYNWLSVLFTDKQFFTYQERRLFLEQVSEKTGATLADPTDISPSFGLGISMQYSANLKTRYYIYQGMTLGFRSMYVYIPKQQILISILVNSSYDGKENHLIDLINQIGTLIVPT